jgi:flavin reductase (DIM6/NTAB) family NADH-FMN oxidoreductase RutF
MPSSAARGAGRRRDDGDVGATKAHVVAAGEKDYNQSERGAGVPADWLHGSTCSALQDPGYSTRSRPSLAICGPATRAQLPDREMQIDSSEFRRILGHWASGVAVVATVTPSGEPRGMTASAVASVSLDPPLVLACVERSADTYFSIREAGVFSISMLPQSGEALARRFAGDQTAGKFAGVAYHAESTGAPVLDQALAWVDCRLYGEHDGGDHGIFVGEVVAGDARGDEPLVYYRSGYHRLGP